MKFKSKMPPALAVKAQAAIFLVVAGVSGGADAQNTTPAVALVPVAQGLDHPWAVAFLPQGQFLLTERPGRMRVVSASGQVSPPLAGVPAVAAGGQGGLLDVVTDTAFARNRRIFFCFSEPAAAGARGNSTALARATLSEDARSLPGVQASLRPRPPGKRSPPLGCRLGPAAGRQPVPGPRR
ncbi:PQQ-dependent sugar dehydrogenase, partial [Acidovorax sp. SD340]|uniref:PQQ-dependent sugar dehydrogenase n=1 Tax=Acidovorax sp. SD340 TaxID=1690268 RepID=UPI000ACCAEF3